MLGVVGKLKITYHVDGIFYEETIDPQAVSLFRLSHCDKILFKVEELTYIEDTIYGAVVTMIEPKQPGSEYLVDGTITEFSAGELGISGTISLCF